MEMTRLQSLRMRNNPIKVIPNGRYLLFSTGREYSWEIICCVYCTIDSLDIQKLEKLKVLCISFNLLTNLPPG